MCDAASGEAVAGCSSVRLLYGFAAESFDQGADGVRVSLRDADGKAHVLEARYLVGCDGGTSTIRKQLDIPLQGRGGIAKLRHSYPTTGDF